MRAQDVEPISASSESPGVARTVQRSRQNRKQLRLNLMVGGRLDIGKNFHPTCIKRYYVTSTKIDLIVRLCKMATTVSPTSSSHVAREPVSVSRSRGQFKRRSVHEEGFRLG